MARQVNNPLIQDYMKELDFNNMLVFDFSSINLQENSKGNCFGCDSCNCDCDNDNDCDSCDSDW